MRRVPILTAIAFAACSTETTSRLETPDASTAGDAGSTIDAGGVDPLPWSWCPTAGDAVNDPAWTYRAGVAPDTELCALFSGDLAGTLRDAAKLRLIAGNYLLPEDPGTFESVIPFCGIDRAGTGGVLDGSGTLTHTIEDFAFINRNFHQYKLRQPLRFGTERWEAEINFDIWQVTGEALPALTVDREWKHGDTTEARYRLCRGANCLDDPGAGAFAWACGEGDLDRTARIDFDRGSLTVHTNVYLVGGPSSPAALARATGMLDGTSFDVTDYFNLGHRPDHHNLGGGYILSFDQTISGACGIEAYVPSPDGSFWADRPSAWLIDCQFARQEELANVNPGP